MKESSKAWGGILFYIFAALMENRKSYSYGGASIIRHGLEINRNPNLLVPAFADILETLFNNLREKGFDPMLWEGYRSPERVKFLVKQGTGIAESLHLKGRAVDIVSRTELWSNPSFFAALGQEAKQLGLVWGGDFSSRRDFPHVEYHGN
jgi:hypothetical protein